MIEDLNVSGMLKNHYLAQAIAEVDFGEFRRQLAYKVAWYGSRVLLASRWEPSSKTCSGCGWVDETLTLADRTFHCQHCGLVIDRDLNAALNVAKLAASLSASRNACGEASAGSHRKTRVKLASVKQEQESLRNPESLAVLSGLGGSFRRVFMENFGRAGRKYGKVWPSSVWLFGLLLAPSLFFEVGRVVSPAQPLP